MRSLALVFALIATPLFAAEQSFAPDAEGVVTFRLPSGNIACTYAPDRILQRDPFERGPQLTCDRVQPAYAVLSLGPRGVVRVISEIDEAGCCSGPVLKYGNFWQEGPFRCMSERTGLTCERIDGRGFSMARARIELF